MPSNYQLPRPDRAIRDFFFAEETPYGLALVRMALSLVLLAVVIHRWPYARELFSSDGAPAPLLVNYNMAGLMPIPNGTTAVALMTILAFSLVATGIGWCTRLATVIAFVLYTYLNLLDCLGTLTKYSVIASHMLLILSMSSCGAVWSLDALLHRRRSQRLQLPGDTGRPKFPAWPRRLLQLLIGLVYLGAAFTKMHTQEFFSSDQMRQWLITNINHDNPLGEHLSLYPATLVVCAYATVLWEVLFVFLAWRGWWRAIMIGLGITFHTFTFLLLGLYIFPLICFTAYLPFINEQDVQFAGRLLRRLSRRWLTATRRVRLALSGLATRIPAISVRQSGAAFAVAMSVVLMIGLEVEYQLDLMGMNRAEAAWTLPELDPVEVSQMLARSPRIRDIDKFLSFDIGGDMIGDVVIAPRNTFAHNEQIIAQCTLIPPHEDMVLSCNLHDWEDRVLDRVQQVVDRRTLRASYSFVLPESVSPGTYYLVFEVAGREVTRRPITLTSR